MERSAEIGEIMSIHELVNQLYQQTEQMLGLSLENDELIEQLESMNLKRSEIRSQIDLYKETNHMSGWPNEVESVLRKCMEMELRLSKELQFQKDQLLVQINKVGAAKRVRQVYNTDNSLEYGAFIDSSK